MHHIEKVNMAIDYIENNLTEGPDLDTVAGAVHYSKYHLHRLFSHMVGLTMHDYIQRRQLTEAAKLLVFSERPILDIALICGYGSQQSFTGAFTSMYKVPPNRYREQEEFYPLQLRFRLEGGMRVKGTDGQDTWSVGVAQEEDIQGWMELVRMVIDGFPHLHEEEYVKELRERMRTKQALIVKDGELVIGIMLFSYKNGSIDFMGCHPLYRKRGVSGALLKKVMDELPKGRDITITTYREGDKADTGQRKEIKGLGFAEAELLVEYGYPTQRFVLSRIRETAGRLPADCREIAGRLPTNCRETAGRLPADCREKIRYK